jgi:hypothetical protein
VHQEFVDRDVVEIEKDLGRLDNPTDDAAHAARGSQGPRHQGGPDARAGPRAAARTTASPAVYTCCLPRKAALRSEAAMAAMITAHVPCERVSQAFLKILEPERQGWEDSGVN